MEYPRPVHKVPVDGDSQSTMAEPTELITTDPPPPSTEPEVEAHGFSMLM